MIIYAFQFNSIQFNALQYITPCLSWRLGQVLGLTDHETRCNASC